MRTPVSVAVAGLGLSGPKLALAFDELPEAELRWIYDQIPEAALSVKRRLPGARVARGFDELLDDEELDAIVIATPAATHHDLVRRALAAGKHVFVEPPLAPCGAAADELVTLAERTQRRLMTGHQVVFHPAARRLKHLIDLGRLGDVYYLYGSRQGLAGAGDGSLLWDGGMRLVSLILWLLGDEPIEVAARGGAYGGGGPIDVAFCHLRFATGIGCELRLSSLEPRETRRVTAVGARAMAVLDELQPERMLTLYERAAGTPSDALAGDGDSWVSATVAPRRSAGDPLRAQCAHFSGAPWMIVGDSRAPTGSGFWG